MKNLMIAAAMALGLTGTAYAGDLAFVGQTEYAFEAEAFSVEAGVEYGVGAFTIAPVVLFDDAAGDLDFTGAEVEVAYAVSANVSVYGRLEADSDFNHSETVVGAAFRF